MVHLNKVGVLVLDRPCNRANAARVRTIIFRLVVGDKVDNF